MIQDPTELEDAILDSEELLDTIVEKVYESNKRVELFQRQQNTLPPPESSEVFIQETQQLEKVSDVTSTLPISSCDTLVTTVISDTTVLCSTVPVTNGISDRLVVDASSGARDSIIVSTPSLTLPTISPSYSTSPISLTSVSYVHCSEPPPLIPRVINTNSLPLSSETSDPILSLPSLSSLSLGISAAAAA